MVVKEKWIHSFSGQGAAECSCSHLTKGYCPTAHTRTRSLKAKITLIRSQCLYLAEAERQNPGILSDVKHTAFIKDFTASSQLTFPIPQSSICHSFTVSSPQALQLIAHLESWSSERQYEMSVPKLTFVYAHLRKMPWQPEFSW